MPADRTDKLTEALRLLWESAEQAPHDFSGDQREWHVPRLARAAVIFAELFPTQSLRALHAARDPWGSPLVKDE